MNEHLDTQSRALVAVMDCMRPHLEGCDKLEGITWRPRFCSCGFDKAQQELMRSPAFTTAIP